MKRVWKISIAVIILSALAVFGIKTFCGGYSYDSETNTLYLHGKVRKQTHKFLLDDGSYEKYKGIAIPSGVSKKDIKHIVADKNTVLPKNSDYLFMEFSGLESVDLSNADTSKVRSMASFFEWCTSLKAIDLKGIDTGNVTNMNRMFSSCISLKTIDMSSSDTHNVSDMGLMFDNCRSIEELDLSNFDTSNVRYMQNMFSCCGSVEKLDLSSFDTHNVSDMSLMFDSCDSIEELDLSSFNTNNVKHIDDIFSCCSNLKTIKVGKNWKKEMISDDRIVFAE